MVEKMVASQADDLAATWASKTAGTMVGVKGFLQVVKLEILLVACLDYEMAASWVAYLDGRLDEFEVVEMDDALVGRMAVAKAEY